MPYAQQQPFSGITLQTMSAPNAPRVLTVENIQKHAQKAASKSQYWQVSKPTRSLSLNGGVNYVNKNFATQNQQDPFIYFPDLAVAGTASEIYNTLARAGLNQINVGGLNTMTRGAAGNQPGTVPLSTQSLIQNSFNPMNPQHAEFLRGLFAEKRQNAKPASSMFTLEQHIEIGTALRNLKRPQGAGNATTAGITSTGTKTRSNTGNKLAERVQDFDLLMDRALSGAPLDKVNNVSSYDANKYTGVRKNEPTRTSRATSITPHINVNGRMVAVPVVAQPANAANFYNYVNTVVASSPKYSAYAPMIIQAFQQAMSGNAGQSVPFQIGSQLGQATPFHQPQLPGLQQNFQQPQLTMGTGQTLANLTQQSAEGPRSPSGRVRSGRTPAGSPAASFIPPVQLPVASQQAFGPGSPGMPSGLPSIGGFPSLNAGSPASGSSFNLPTIGGGGLPNLPSIGGGLPSLPTIGGQGGLPSLPTVQGLNFQQ